FLGAAAVLFLPTFLMGGTFPILARSVAQSPFALGVGVSQLYWVNTFGAVAGTLTAGFILLPTLGLRGTIACAVSLNFVAGLVALRIARNFRYPAAIEDSEVGASVDLAGRQPALNWILILCAVVGCTAFVYEIAWTRLLSITISSSTYAFTL